MKRIIALLISILVLLMPLASCADIVPGGGGGSSSSQQDTSDDINDSDESEEMPEIEKNYANLEQGLDNLKKDGWKKSGNEYVLTTNEDGTKGEYRVSAKGNNAVVKVDFDYGADNNEMIEFYKDDAEAATAVPAYWYSYVVGMLEIYEGSVDYTLSVAGTEVSSGKLTYDEAVDAANNYFD